MLSLKTPASSIVTYESRTHPLKMFFLIVPPPLTMNLSWVFGTFMAVLLMAPSFETLFRSFVCLSASDCSRPATAPILSVLRASASGAGLYPLLFYRPQYLCITSVPLFK